VVTTVPTPPEAETPVTPVFASALTVGVPTEPVEETPVNVMEMFD
jgi:hypothetical protein